MAMVKQCPVCSTINDQDAVECKNENCQTSLMSIVSIDEESISIKDNFQEENNQQACQHTNRFPNGQCMSCFQIIRDTSEKIQKWSLSFPWSEDIEVQDSLWIGRLPPASENLIAKLEKNYLNVSRNHAEFFILEGQLYLRDLASTNGTYINEEKIAPMSKCLLKHHDSVRFAKDLRVYVVKG